MEDAVTRDEIIAVIKKYSKKLRRTAQLTELVKSTKISRLAIRTNFGNYTEALRACGLEGQGYGYRLRVKDLFLDWAKVVRKLRRVPTVADFELHGKHSYRPFGRVFAGWKEIPSGMIAYAKRAGLEESWKDVLDIAAKHLQSRRQRRNPGEPRPRSKPRILPNRPIYGPPVTPTALTYAPTNEAGVIFLFGGMCRKLGFAVARLQSAFPDCDAMREIEPERWQPVKIEFEYESKNFLLHQHVISECDVIVCWRHNWPQCPLEVVELKSAMKQSLPEEQE
ncbi:MAG: hypothetical protein JWM83_714 [Candidatus Angelobacter sp.]|nr:hypothetical protein [Candidatus Angelobacter sp.]